MADSIQVRSTGPIFDGSLDRATSAATERALDRIADQGVNLVHQRLHQVLRHPTGNYERHVITNRAFGDRAVTDGRSVKGPWLEGVSARNQSTRFKGYQTFRRATAALEQLAAGIADRTISDRIRGL